MDPVLSDHPHGQDVPRDAQGNCATCGQPIRENKPAVKRKRSGRLVIPDPDGSVEEKLVLLSERWEADWPTMSMASQGWKGRVADYALQEVLDMGIMPSEEGQ